MDVVAINRTTRDILLGECKWGDEAVGREVIIDLIEKKTPLVLKDISDGKSEWKVHYAFFTRRGFTQAAKNEVNKHGCQLMDLKMIDQTLGST